MNRYPSVMEVRRVTSLARFQQFFPQRTFFADPSKPSADCSICMGTIDCRKSVAVFTNCGHFYCLSCAMRAFMSWQVSESDLEVDNDDVAVVNATHRVRWVAAKRKESCVCSICRMSVNGPQPSLVSCFGQFSVFDMLSVEWWLNNQRRLQVGGDFVLPVLMLLDLGEVSVQCKRQRQS